MKNTAFALAADNVILLPRPGFINRWGAMPFLFWIASTGIPLQRNLEVSQPIWTADVYATSLAATSTASTLHALPYVVFMAVLYVSAGLMLLGKPKTVFSLVTRQWPLLLLMLFVAVSMLWSPNREKVLMNITHNLGFLLIALAAALRYRKNPWLLPKHIGYVLGLNVALHLVAVLALPAYAIEWDGRWRGLTTQPNGLGAIAFCAFWANAAVLINTGKDRYHLHLLLAACSMVVMIGANSMTSIISSICALGLIFTFSGTTSRYRAGLRIFVGSMAAVVAGAAVGVLFLGNAMDWGKLLGLAGRSGDFTGRTDIWLEAIKAIAGRPWIGWGFDDNAYLIKTTGLPYLTYHNGYLDLLARGGVVALGLFFLLLGKWVLETKKSTRVGSESIPFAMPFMLAMLVYNLTEATLVTPRDQMWLIFLAILFLGACKKWPPPPSISLRRQRP